MRMELYDINGCSYMLNALVDPIFKSQLKLKKKKG